MSEQILSVRRLAIVPTLKCNLRCKLCCNLMPKYKNPQNISIENIINDIDHVFEIFDYIEWLQFVGGEIFMNKDMWIVYEYALKYKPKFSKLILMTNGTIAPSEKDIEALKKYGENCQVQISDYGHLSYKRNEFVDLLTENGIDFVIKKYYGDTQYYGGWIDNTKLIDLRENEDLLKQKVCDCSQVEMKNMHCIDGKLHQCSVSAFMSDLGVVIPQSADFVDLNNNSISLNEKRKIIRNFYNHPCEACKYCAGFGKASEKLERFPAAEQIR